MTTLASAAGVLEPKALARSTKSKMVGMPAVTCHCWPEPLELGVAGHCVRCGRDLVALSDSELREARSSYGWQLLTKAVHYTALEIKRKAEDQGLDWEDEVRHFGYMTEGGWT